MSNFKHVIQLFSLIYFVDGDVKIWNVGPTMDVVSGSTLILNCTGNSNLIWYFEGTNIYSSDFKTTNIRTNQSFKSILEIDNIKFNDTGFYVCKSDGFSHRSVYVFVNDKEHLFLPQETDLIHMNHFVGTYIPCRPTFSSLNVTLWRHSEQISINESVSFDPRSGFLIDNSMNHLSGFFWCKAKYKDHTEILTFNLIYNNNSNLQLPLIDQGPVVDIPKKSTIELKCSGEMRIYWQIPENTRFENNRWDYYFIYNGIKHEAVIKITDAQTSDSGSLKCCYSYKCMSEQFSSVFLRVNDPEILYIPKIKPILTKELQCVPYIIQCLPSMSNVTVELQFSKAENTSSTQENLNKDFSYYPTLGFIPNDFQKFRKQYSSGTFFCEFKYENFSQRIEKSILSLAPKYSMEITSLNKTPIEGDDVEIVCEGCKFTFKNITWKWKGNDQKYFIPVLNNYSLSNIKLFDESTAYDLKKVLKIENINMENVGKYECVGITEDNMEETQYINLKIKAIEKPTFINTNMNGNNVTIRAGKKFEFICIVHGEPYPIVTWYKNDQIIRKAHANDIQFYWSFLKLTINRVGKLDSGIYRCEARNRGGQIFAELTLNVTTEERIKMIKEKVTSTLSAVVISFTVICALLTIGLLFVILLIIKYRQHSKSYI